MNESERRLTRELDRAAATKTVDVDHLWEQVQARTSGKTRPVRRRRALAPYLAAASVAGVLVVTATLLADSGQEPSPTASPQVTPVPTTKSTKPAGPRAATIGGWSCPDQRQLQPGTDSMTLKPVRAVLDPAKAPPEAVAYGVPQYQFTLNGTSGTLDYGDASGQRIARTELTRTATGWLVGSRTVCSGPGGRPSPDPVKLGKYTQSPLPLDPKSAQLKATPPIGDPILLDDRTYYDAAGMLRHRSLYVFATKGGYEYASMPGEEGSYSIGGQKEDTIGGAVLSPTVGTDSTYVFGADDNLGLVHSFLTGKQTVEGLTSRDAATDAAGLSQQFAFPGGRTLYTVVPAPAADGDTYVTVHRTTGDDPPRRF